MQRLCHHVRVRQYWVEHLLCGGLYRTCFALRICFVCSLLNLLFYFFLFCQTQWAGTSLEGKLESRFLHFAILRLNSLFVRWVNLAGRERRRGCSFAYYRLFREVARLMQRWALLGCLLGISIWTGLESLLYALNIFHDAMASHLFCELHLRLLFAERVLQLMQLDTWLSWIGLIS